MNDTLSRSTPDALIVGHLTRDVIRDGAWRLGGPSIYAARTASLRGLRVAVVTSAPDDVISAARAAAPGVTFHCKPATSSTTFENLYTTGGRRQFLRAIAAPLGLDDIPPAWRAAPVVLLAPVAGELDPRVGEGLSATTLGLAPQGWLRQWDADGRVYPSALNPRAEEILPRCAALILSHEDLAGAEASPDALERAELTLRRWAWRVSCLAITCGSRGAELWRGTRKDVFPGLQVRETDPTGAGDVFAMTFLCGLAAGSAPEVAMAEANAVAALSVEGLGVTTIPTPEAARARFSHVAGS